MAGEFGQARTGSEGVVTAVAHHESDPVAGQKGLKAKTGESESMGVTRLIVSATFLVLLKWHSLSLWNMEAEVRL